MTPRGSIHVEPDGSTVGLLVLKQESLGSPEKKSHLPIDIVAVHGLGGDRMKSWTHVDPTTAAETMWLKDLLPTRFPDARVMTFGYKFEAASSLIFPTSGIRREAINLLIALHQQRKLDRQKARPIIFIGCSFGGIIIKQALSIANNEGTYLSISASTTCLIFLGTPHRPADSSSWKHMFFNIARVSYNSTLADDLSFERTQSILKTIAEVSEEFYTFAERYSISSFYETKKTPLVGSVVVERYSAILGIPSENQKPCDVDHLAIGKFSEKGTGFDLLCSCIKSDPPNLDEEYIGCLRTLSVVNPGIYLPKIQPPLPGTFSWVISHEAYCGWLGSRKPAFLHLHGPSGTGKTVLSSFLLKTLRAGGLGPIAYFACDIGDERRRSARNLLKSLIYQLLLREPSLFRHVHQFYEAAKSRLNWTEEELWIMCRTLLSCPGHEGIVCIIDALDECDSSRTQFLKDLIDFASVTDSAFKIIITSRPHPEIHNQLKSGFAINLATESGARSDVESVTERGISDLVAKVPKYLGFEDDLSKMFHQPGVTFRSVIFTLDGLEMLRIRSTPASIRQALQLLRCDFHFVYERLFRDIPLETRPWARNALSWIVFALRPLKIEQLAVALAIEPNVTFQSIENQTSRDMAEDLKQVFGPLIRIENDEISLAHPHAGEFLLSQTLSELVWYGLERSAHAYIAQSCLTYLSMEEFGAEKSFIEYSQSGFPELAVPQTSRYKFLMYAAQYWPAHYHQVVEVTPSLQDSVVHFLEKTSQFRVWSELQWFCEDPRRDRGLFSPLYIALELGVSVAVEALLHGHAAITDGEKITALSLAVGNEHVAVVTQLLKAGMDVEAALRDPMVLQKVSYAQNGPLVKQILDAVASEEAKCTYEATVLCLAAQNGNVVLVKQLLRPGIEINSKISDSTSLHLAAENGHHEVVEELLRAGADPNILDNTKSTPLHLAARNGHQRVLEDILETGVDSNLACNTGSTALHMAAENGHQQVVEKLLQFRADANSADNANSTAMHLAAENGHYEVVEKLLQARADPNPAGRSTTPLQLAAGGGYLGIVSILLEAGVDSNLTCNTGSTALHMAAENGHQQVVEKLLQSGVDIDLANNASSVALHLAAENGHYEVVEKLLQAGADPNPAGRSTPLHLAADNGYLGVVRILLEVGAYQDAIDVKGATPLHLAAKRGHKLVVKELLEANADIEAKTKQGWTPLHSAFDKSEVVELLLKNRANVDATNDRGSTPLTLAAEEGSDTVVELLIKAGANLGATSKNGATPLHRAAQGGKLATVKLLLKAGADPWTADITDGITPLGLASALRHQDVVLELQSVMEEFVQKLQLEDNKTVLSQEATLVGITNFASTYRDQGQLKEAENLERWLQETLGRHLGEEHPHTLRSMTNLASTYRSQKLWEKAEELEVKFLGTARRIFGGEDPKTLMGMVNLALTYRDQKRWKEAEQLQVQVLDISKRVLGEEHPETLARIANLASTYCGRELWEEAEKLQVQVLELSKRVLGKEHPDTLMVMQGLAETYYGQNRLEETEELEVQVLEISKRTLGEEHPDTLARMAGLGSACQLRGQWNKAGKLQSQVLELSKRVLGEEHPDTLSRMERLSKRRRARRLWEEEKELQLQAVELSKKSFREGLPGYLAEDGGLGSDILRSRTVESRRAGIVYVGPRITEDTRRGSSRYFVEDGRLGSDILRSRTVESRRAGIVYVGPRTTEDTRRGSSRYFVEDGRLGSDILRSRTVESRRAGSVGPRIAEEDTWERSSRYLAEELATLNGK